MKRKIFNLTGSNGSNSLGEGEIKAQLNDKFHITGKRKKVKRVKFLQFFQQVGQLGRFSKSSKPQITWFGLPRN
jgi:hypothetical protein